MSTEKPQSGDSSRDQVIAGEYVLGVLSAEDRRKVEARMVLDRNFAAMIDHWQFNLSSFDAMYEPVTPPASVFTTVERRLFPDAAPGTQRVGLWNSIIVWRSLSFAAIAGVVAMGAVNANLFTSPSTTRPLVADLAGTGTGAANPINLVALYDAADGTLKVTPVAARQTEEKSLELWLVEGDNAPVAIGVLPQTGEGQIIIPEHLRARLNAGTTLAVSVEPLGGSPTGAATGPVIALGKTRLP